MQHERPEETDRVELDAGDEGLWIVKALTQAGLCESSSEARRMIQQGAVKLDGGETLRRGPQAGRPQATLRRAGGQARFRRHRGEVVSVFRIGAACLLLTVGGAGASHASAPDTLDVSIPPAGDFLAGPVFYERNPPSVLPGELDLLRQDRVKLPHYAPVDIADFDWTRNSRVEPMWFMQMQEMRFLLPAIASELPGDRALAKKSLVGWFRVYMTPEPRIRDWGEPMTVAYRAMVFVFYLKRESSRAEPDPDVVGLLNASIREHQRYLASPNESDDISNHAFIDALGLFETTRVFADRRAAALALRRLRAMLDRSVTPRGVEKEHTPYYHFVVMLWVGQTADYLKRVPSVPGAFVEQLVACARRMRDAAYFLQDHGGVVPQIGDGDSVSVESFSAEYRVEPVPGTGTTLYDPDAGYAIYKGNALRGNCRYLVFRNPIDGTMPNHAHTDVLSVYFSNAGETILADAGRYTYTPGPRRRYFLSACAHNTIVASASLMAPPRHLTPLLARSVADRSNGETVSWFASRVIAASECRRAVYVDEQTNVVSVVDSILPAGTAGEPEELAWVWNLGCDVVAVKASMPQRRDGWEWWLTTRRGQRVRMRIVVSDSGSSPPGSVELVRGQEDPMLGWYAPKQAVRRPTTVIVVRARPGPRLVVKTDVEVVAGNACDAKMRGYRAGR